MTPETSTGQNGFTRERRTIDIGDENVGEASADKTLRLDARMQYVGGDRDSYNQIYGDEGDFPAMEY